MGFIRGFLLVIVCIVLFVTLLLANIFLTFTLSLSAENVKANIGPMVSDVVNSQTELSNVINEKLPLARQYCENYSDYIFSYNGNEFQVPCDIISAVESNADSIIQQSVSGLVDQIYYQEYNCNFWSCLSETGQPFFLVSKMAHDYWEKQFYTALLVIIILFVLGFLLVVNKPNILIISGILVLASSSIFRVVGKVAMSLNEEFSEYAILFFFKSYYVFIIGLLVGVILLGFGISLKVAFWESIKKRFSKEDVREIVEEEIREIKEERREKSNKKKK